MIDAMFILKCFYLMLPAYFANMAPVFFKNINLLRYPLDFNTKLGGKPLLGKNKTFRGLVFGVILAIFVAYVQSVAYTNDFFSGISFLKYESWVVIGVLMGLGAIAGDAVESFFKRRLGIKPGGKFIPFDQTDYVIGALVFIIPVFGFDVSIFLVSIILGLVLHIMINHISFYLGFRNEKW
jgi:CDP-2,3-bis-(O-geranylgeranyl)-sn-glycerol synthase